MGNSVPGGARSAGDRGSSVDSSIANPLTRGECSTSLTLGEELSLLRIDETDKFERTEEWWLAAAFTLLLVELCLETGLPSSSSWLPGRLSRGGLMYISETRFRVERVCIHDASMPLLGSSTN